MLCGGTPLFAWPGAGEGVDVAAGLNAGRGGSAVFAVGTGRWAANGPWATGAGGRDGTCGVVEVELGRAGQPCPFDGGGAAGRLAGC